MNPRLPIPPGTFIHPTKPWPPPPASKMTLEEMEKEIRSAAFVRGMAWGVFLGMFILGAALILAEYQIQGQINWVCEYRP